MSKVHVAPEAAAEFTAIFEYLLERAGLDVAEAAGEELGAAVVSLSALPERGKYPPGLLSEGITLFRGLRCSPGRIFYRVAGSEAWVVAVLDGRRDVAQLLPEGLVR